MFMVFHAVCDVFLFLTIGPLLELGPEARILTCCSILFEDDMRFYDISINTPGGVVWMVSESFY